MCRLAFIIILGKKNVAVIPRSKWRFSWKHHLYTRDFSLPRLIIGGEFFGNVQHSTNHVNESELAQFWPLWATWWIK